MGWWQSDSGARKRKRRSLELVRSKDILRLRVWQSCCVNGFWFTRSWNDHKSTKSGHPHSLRNFWWQLQKNARYLSEGSRPGFNRYKKSLNCVRSLHQIVPWSYWNTQEKIAATHCHQSDIRTALYTWCGCEKAAGEQQRHSLASVGRRKRALT